jgi:hypothetical protein
MGEVDLGTAKYVAVLVNRSTKPAPTKNLPYPLPWQGGDLQPTGSSHEHRIGTAPGNRQRPDD